MRRQRRKHPILKIVLISILVIGLAAGTVYSHFGGFGTGPCSDTAEFLTYAKSVLEITIPEQTKIVALGEATHGNAEFQQLKLDVFQRMVEEYDIRAFALEGDYGGCEAVNRYIHGAEGTAEEAAAAVGFAIYRTDQMAELIEWMRKYNETAENGEDLVFYGFDMQRYKYNYRYLLEAAQELGADISALGKLWDGDDYSDAYTRDQRAAVFEEVKAELEKMDDPKAARAVHLADVLLQNCELGKTDDSSANRADLRDRMMAENTLWILGQEEQRGNSAIFLSGHNGHMEQKGSYGPDAKVMGNILSDELGEAYYAIGTDFYHAECNLPGSNGKRICHQFYSYDPLAKAAWKCGFDMCWLDFSAVPDDSLLKEDLTGYIWMGSLGEFYSWIMNVLPMSYRVWRCPAEMYDSLILVTDAHPTEISAAD